MPYADNGPARLYYEVFDLTPPWVENPETILFHHGVGIDRRIWSEWLPGLCDRYRLVWFDVRGYGKSTIPAADYTWNMDDLAADACAVADAAGAGKFHFVGESLGGAMAFYLALHHADRLLSIAPCTSPHKGASVQWLDEWRDFIGENGVDGWSKRMMDRRFPPGLLPDAKWRWFDSVQAACDANAILGMGEMLIGLDLSAELGKITLPVQLIAADRSPFLPMNVILATRDLLSEPRLHVIGGARHGVVYSHGAICARILRRFLGGAEEG